MKYWSESSTKPNTTLGSDRPTRTRPALTFRPMWTPIYSCAALTMSARRRWSGRFRSPSGSSGTTRGSLSMIWAVKWSTWIWWTKPASGSRTPSSLTPSKLSACQTCSRTSWCGSTRMATFSSPPASMWSCRARWTSHTTRSTRRHVLCNWPVVSVPKWPFTSANWTCTCV